MDVRLARSRVLAACAAAAVCFAAASAITASAGNGAASPRDARAGAVRYLLARQQPDGGFAEPGSRSTPGLTAWAVIGLRAAGVAPARLAAAGAFLERVSADAGSLTDAALVLTARAALGDAAPDLVERIRSGAPGPTVNSAIWSTIALRAAGQRPDARTVRAVRAAQSRSGGWSWARRGAADSNDTAAAIQALRAVGVRGRPVTRGLAFLRRLQSPSGGFRLLPRREPDVQSTAWAVQAFAAAGRPSPRGALDYLMRQQRRDGALRYSSRYAATPVWVTAQAVAALARRPLPVRAP